MRLWWLIMLHCSFGVAAIPKLLHVKATQIQNETLVRLYLSEPVSMPKLELDQQQTQLKFKLKVKPANWVSQEQVFDLDWVHGWHWQQLDGVSELTFALKTKPNVEASLFEDGLQLRFYKQLQEANVLNHPNQSNAILEIAPKPKQPISLRLLDAPVQEVLYTLSRLGGVNLVSSDSVQGQVTLQVKNQPWDAVLALILNMLGLEQQRVSDDLMLILPRTEMRVYEQGQNEQKSALEATMPTTTEAMQIQYAKAEQMTALIQKSGMPLLSKAGALAFDARTNVVLVHDTRARRLKIKQLVRRLDVPIKQVVIDVRVVTMRDHTAEDFGLRWGFTQQDSKFNTTGRLEGLNDLNASRPPEGSKGLNVNLPAMPNKGEAATVAMRWAVFDPNRFLDLELSALEQEHVAEVLARPRITTINHQTARIEQGTEIPYVESTASGATSVAFKKAALSMEVTPQILPNEQILLDLKVRQDHPGEEVVTSTGHAISIDMQRIESQVLVANQQTVVLGGIYQEKLLHQVSKVPWLGDLPWLGFLFRTQKQLLEKHEVLIFVTPKIVVAF